MELQVFPRALAWLAWKRKGGEEKTERLANKTKTKQGKIALIEGNLQILFVKSHLLIDPTFVFPRSPGIQAKAFYINFA